MLFLRPYYYYIGDSVDSIDDSDRGGVKTVQANLFGTTITGTLTQSVSFGELRPNKTSLGLRYPGMQRLMARQEIRVSDVGIQATVGMLPDCKMVGGILQSFSLNKYGRAINQGAGFGAGGSGISGTITFSSNDTNLKISKAEVSLLDSENDTIYTPSDFGVNLDISNTTFQIAIQINMNYSGSLSRGNVRFTSNYSNDPNGLKFISRTY